MKRSFERDLIEHCAPTLAGLKPANLFHVRTDDAPALHGSVARWNAVLQKRGLVLTILKECTQNHSFLVYLYRAHHLQKELADADVAAFLQGEGYTAGSTNNYLQQLSERLCVQEDFPHEIGLFLGYPLEDVVGFIEHKGKNFTCCGHWKTYGDATVAQKQFERFNHCTKVYLHCFCSGVSINRLAVAV